jgi:peptidyl-prolyl cis-trans isomerase A (cyclophilin A)
LYLPPASVIFFLLIHVIVLSCMLSIVAAAALQTAQKEFTLPTGVYAQFVTSEGNFTVRLFDQEAPKTVENFIGLVQGTKEWTDPRTNKKVKQPYYDGIIFHRVISGFMIQGGDPTGTGMGGPGYQFADEFHPDLRFDRPYLLAMANAGPGTNGSQFFITVGPTPHLNRRHTIFGEVADAESRAVVDSIAKTATDRSDRPLEAVVVERVDIED